MSTILPPFRSSHAAFRAPIGSSKQDIRYRLTAIVLIATLALPMWLARSGRAERMQSSPIPAPVSAPPQAFLVGQTETQAVASVFKSGLTRLFDSYSSPDIPSGFEAAKVPTTSERLTSLIHPLLNFITSTKSVTPNRNSQIPEPPPPTGTVLFDFDGDGKADIGRWHSSNTEFKVRNSGDDSYSTYTIGSSSAVPAPGDYDGDGKTDAAVFNAGSWTIKKSSNGST